jgi:hypothetical protein
MHNAHTNIFITPFAVYNAHTPTSGRVRKYRQRMEELFKNSLASSNIGSDDLGGRVDLNSLMFNKY